MQKNVATFVILYKKNSTPRLPLSFSLESYPSQKWSKGCGNIMVGIPQKSKQRIALNYASSARNSNHKNGILFFVPVFVTMLH